MPSGSASTSLREAPRVAHRHLGGDPAAETGADQNCVRQPERRGEIEIKVGEVIDAFRASRAARSCPSPDGAARSRDKRRASRSSHGRCGCSPSPGCRNSSGRTFPAVFQFQCDVGDLDRTDHACCCPSARVCSAESKTSTPALFSLPPARRRRDRERRGDVGE